MPVGVPAKRRNILHRATVGALAALICAVSGPALAEIAGPQPRPVAARSGGPAAKTPPVRVDDTITLKNLSGAIVTNYPLQFGRPFVCGEIAHYPQVLVSGAAIRTQADVKNRCPDGSVKFAVIAAVLPSIPVTESVTLKFRDQPGGNNTPLTAAEMMNPAYDFDARTRLAFTSGQTGVGSARKMLETGDYKRWTSGPIAQTIELADDTAARKYDLGSGDGYRPFRPRFVATFWPGLKKVHVRFVGENGLTTELSDLRYALALSLGKAAPREVYSIDLTGAGPDGKIHSAMTQWTKQFWIGGEPEARINIDQNLAYLAATKYLPNFDPSSVVSEATISGQDRAFAARPNDIYDATWNKKGKWQSGMATAGSRPDIGPYPEWTTLWLYSGDYRMRRVAVAMADLAGGFPAQLRESDRRAGSIGMIRRGREQVRAARSRRPTAIRYFGVMRRPTTSRIAAPKPPTAPSRSGRWSAQSGHSMGRTSRRRFTRNTS